MWNVKANCQDYAARLETALQAASSERPMLAPDLQQHLASCQSCRGAFEDAAWSRALLQSTLAPAAAPFGFSTRVLQAIRAEQNRRAAQGNIFWRPLEHLAAKVALAAATMVMLMSLYVYGFTPRSGSPTGQDQAYTLVPQPENQQPATPDEVLMYLAENAHGR
jgi:predicted anti-sigma-YlaC factor YlaD